MSIASRIANVPTNRQIAMRCPAIAWGFGAIG
jgi:hypothetical protein